MILDYVAPEVLNISVGYDYKCDLYSLGGIFYFLLSNQESQLYNYSITNTIHKLKEELKINCSTELILIMESLLEMDVSKRMSIEEVVALLGGDVEKLKFQQRKLESNMEENSMQKPSNLIYEIFDDLDLEDDESTSLENKEPFTPQIVDEIELERERSFHRNKYVNILKSSPFELQDNKEYVLDIVEKCGEAIQYASPRLKNDRNVAITAINNNGFSLKYVSKELQDDEDIVLLAIDNYALALGFASDNLKKDRNIVMEAVKRNGFSLHYTPQEIRNDKQIVIEAVKNYGRSLTIASKELQNDRDVVKIAVKKQGNALFFLSKEFQNDYDIVMEAVQNDGYSLKYASKHLQNDSNIVIQAIVTSSSTTGISVLYESVSKELLNDKEFLKNVISKTNGSTLRFFSNSIKNDKELLKDLVSISKLSLQYSSLNDNDEFVLSLIEENSELLLYISSRLKKDFDFILKVVKKNVNCFTYIDSDFKNDQKFIQEIIKKDITTLQFVSQKLLNDKLFCLELVRKNGECLQYLSNMIKDDVEVVQEAVHNSSECYIYASKRIQYSRNSKKYEIIKKINEGGEGIVYLVKENEKFFAEKRIVVESIEKMNLILNEFSKVCSLENDNVFKVKEIIQDENTIINVILIRIIMELYEGDLLMLINNRFPNGIPEKLLIHFAKQITKGLIYLHGNQIIHGDLKPENIFYSQNSSDNFSLKIGDFGMNYTKNFDFYGSLMYVAPEIIIEKQNHSEVSDLFSLGGILLRMMENKDQILYVECLKETFQINNGKYSKELNDLVRNLLNPNPKMRMNSKEVFNSLTKIRC